MVNVPRAPLRPRGSSAGIPKTGHDAGDASTANKPATPQVIGGNDQDARLLPRTLFYCAAPYRYRRAGRT